MGLGEDETELEGGELVLIVGFGLSSDNDVGDGEEETVFLDVVEAGDVKEVENPMDLVSVIATVPEEEEGESVGREITESSVVVNSTVTAEGEVADVQPNEDNDEFQYIV